MADWTPDGLLTRLQAASARTMPPAPTGPSPFLWGTEQHDEAVPVEHREQNADPRRLVGHAVDETVPSRAQPPSVA